VSAVLAAVSISKLPTLRALPAGSASSPLVPRIVALAAAWAGNVVVSPGGAVSASVGATQVTPTALASTTSLPARKLLTRPHGRALAAASAPAAAALAAAAALTGCVSLTLPALPRGVPVVFSAAVVTGAGARTAGRNLGQATGTGD
jgi:hypothetical protein